MQFDRFAKWKSWSAQQKNIRVFSTRFFLNLSNSAYFWKIIHPVFWQPNKHSFCSHYSSLTAIHVLDWRFSPPFWIEALKKYFYAPLVVFYGFQNELDKGTFKVLDLPPSSLIWVMREKTSNYAKKYKCQIPCDTS